MKLFSLSLYLYLHLLQFTLFLDCVSLFLQPLGVTSTGSSSTSRLEFKIRVTISTYVNNNKSPPDSTTFTSLSCHIDVKLRSSRFRHLHEHIMSRRVNIFSPLTWFPPHSIVCASLSLLLPTFLLTPFCNHWWSAREGRRGRRMGVNTLETLSLSFPFFLLSASRPFLAQSISFILFPLPFSSFSSLPH